MSKKIRSNSRYFLPVGVDFGTSTPLSLMYFRQCVSSPAKRTPFLLCMRKHLAVLGPMPLTDSRSETEQYLRSMPLAARSSILLLLLL